MSVPKAIAEARAKVREAEAAITQHEAAIAAAKKAREPLQRRYMAYLARHSRTLYLMQRPQGVIALPHGLALGVGYYNTRDEQKPTAKRIAELMLAGEVTLAAPDNGPSLKARGAAQRIRSLSPLNAKAVAAAERKLVRAQEAAARASKELADLKQAAFEAGGKVTVDEVVAAAAGRAALAKAVPRDDGPWSGPGYELARLRERVLPQAQKHLAHAESRVTTPCPCTTCIQRRESERWEVERKRLAKVREAEERAAIKRRAKLGRRRFTCPNCHSDIVSVVDTDNGRAYVECSTCESAFEVATISSQRVARSTPLGEVMGEEDEEVA